MNRWCHCCLRQVGHARQHVGWLTVVRETEYRIFSCTLRSCPRTRPAVSGNAEICMHCGSLVYALTTFVSYTALPHFCFDFLPSRRRVQRFA